MRKVKEKVNSLLTGGYLTALVAAEDVDETGFVKETFEGLIRPETGKETDPKQATVDIINYVLFFIGVVAIVFIVWGGIQFIMAGGDPEKVTKAKNTLLYAVLGIVVIVMAFAIVNWAKAIV